MAQIMFWFWLSGLLMGRGVAAAYDGSQTMIFYGALSLICAATAWWKSRTI